jgi:hypothetical protein
MQGFLFCFAVLEFELRASHLLGRHFTAYGTPPFNTSSFEDSFVLIFVENSKTAMMGYACNPSTQEAEARES